ncbi:hypothetical protein BLNAU_20545 [Blattamonas nauphoetae]|uniref:Uncharacterized protein n=1 Tax=Blattamonas nauphoetae TaxID=2049346 RepID=A0ABQ9WYF3_9EUKA|nr:hypothetical protein BLNAU_20545 [Blattamonas nauphoetae]
MVSFPSKSLSLPCRFYAEVCPLFLETFSETNFLYLLEAAHIPGVMIETQIMEYQKVGIMFFLFALLSASSFKVPNDVVITITPSAIGADGKGTITVTGTGLTDPTRATTVDVVLEYTPAGSSNVVVELKKEGVAVADGTLAECIIDITVAAAGSATVFQEGVKHSLTTAKVGTDAYSATTADDVTFTIPAADKTLALEYTEASATTYTVAATFGDEQTADVTVTFTPAEGTAVPVTFAFTEATKGKTASATLTVGAEGSATVFKIGTKYTATLADYTVTGKDFTPANPLTTVYASKLTPVDEEKKDGAKDKVSMTCTNGMIKAALIEGDTKTQTLVVKEGESDAITITQSENKINFTITAGQCVVDYLYNDAKIAKGKTGTAKLTLGTTEFLEGAVTFDGSKSVASIIAALLAVLAIVF